MKARNAGILGVPNASGPMADAEGRKRQRLSTLGGLGLIVQRLTRLRFSGAAFEACTSGSARRASWILHCLLRSFFFVWTLHAAGVLMGLIDKSSVRACLVWILGF